MYRLGYLSQPTRESVARALESFLKALRELGWIEGQNLLIEYRWAEGDVGRLPALAAELVRLDVDSSSRRQDRLRSLRGMCHAAGDPAACRRSDSAMP